MGRGAYDTTGLPSPISPPPESTINVFDEPRPFQDCPRNVSQPSEDLMKTQDPGPVGDIPTSTYDPLLFQGEESPQGVRRSNRANSGVRAFHN